MSKKAESQQVSQDFELPLMNQLTQASINSMGDKTRMDQERTVIMSFMNESNKEEIRKALMVFEMQNKQLQDRNTQIDNLKKIQGIVKKNNQRCKEKIVQWRIELGTLKEIKERAVSDSVILGQNHESQMVDESIIDLL